MIDFSATEEDILNHLTTGMAPVPVIDTEAEDEYLDSVGDGDFSPYVGVIWGGPIVTSRDRGIIGVRHDLLTGYVTVRVAAPDTATLRYLKNKLTNLLLGYRPYNSGELEPRAGMAYSIGNAQVQPTRYYREDAYAYRTNTIDEVS